ncbi:NADH-quinone oxidoreductase subunit N [candidate division KSB1 bacterium]
MMPDINIAALLPEILLAIAAMTVLLVGAFWSRGGQTAAYLLSQAAIVAAAVITILAGGGVVTAFGDMVLVDRFSLILRLILLLAAFLACQVARGYLRREEVSADYYVLLLLATVGMMLMVTANNLLVLFLGIEVLSFSFYILNGFLRRELAAGEAALKYFILGAFATAFLVFGLTFTFGGVGSLSFRDIALAMGRGAGGSAPLILVGLGFLIIGLGFKVAAVPFHMWAPDVYQGAPTSVTAFLSTGSKAAGLAALFRMLMFAYDWMADDWRVVIAVLSILSMVWGNFAAVAQTNLKRMLAYSSIAHSAYVLLALVSFNDTGLSALFFYLTAYTVMTLGAFAILALTGIGGTTGPNLEDVSGLAWRHPWIALSFSVFLFSLAGVPPTAGFMGKYLIFSSIIRAGYPGLAVVAILTAVVSVYYYLRVTVQMYMREAPESGGVELDRLNIYSSTAIILAALAVIYLGVFPGRLLNFLMEAAGALL